MNTVFHKTSGKTQLGSLVLKVEIVYLSASSGQWAPVEWKASNPQNLHFKIVVIMR